MRRRLFAAILVLLILLPTWGIFTIVGKPEVRSFRPQDGAGRVPAASQLRLTFTRTMQPESVLERFSIEPEQSGSFSWEGKTLVFTPDHPWPSAETIRVHLAPGARTTGVISFALDQDHSWSFTVTQPRLLYLYPANAAPNLYLFDPLSGQGSRLTNVPGGILEYSLTPDGTAIYYSANNRQGGNDIYRIDLLPLLMEEQSTPTKEALDYELILSCATAYCRAPSISPDGAFLAYERTAFSGQGEPAYPQVWLLPFDKADAQPQLAGDPSHQTLMPSWSSQGVLAFYDTNKAAYIFFDPRSGERKSFSNQSGQPGAWDPSGKYFLAPEVDLMADTDIPASGTQVVSHSRLVRFSLLTGATEDLTSGENIDDSSPAYSPDGAYIAYSRRYLNLDSWTPGRQVWLMQSDSSQAEQKSQSPVYNHYDFAWSPTNRQIAFVRFDMTDQSRQPEVWLLDSQSGATTRLISGGFAPQWIP